MNSNWKQIRLKNVLREINDPSETGSEMLFMLSKDRGLVPRESNDGLSIADSYVGYKRFAAGDLVMNKMQAWNGVFGVATNGGLVSPDYAVFRPRDPSTIDMRFMNYLVRTPHMIEVFAGESRGIGTGFNRLHPAAFLGVQALIPPVEEQRRIADFLDDQVARIDSLQSTHQLGVKLSDEAFTSWLETRTAGAPRLPMRRLADSITSGPRGWGDLVSDSGQRMFMRINNISGNGIEPNLENVAWVSPSDDAESRRAQLVAGDLLVSITASIGDVAVVDESVAGASFSQHVARVRLKSPTEARAIAWAAGAREPRERLRSMSFGGTKVGLGLQDVLSWEIPVVSRSQADFFVREVEDHFQHHEALADAHLAALQLLEERKRAVITAAVTGELDVATARPIGVGKWVPNVGASVDSATASQAQAPNVGGIG